MAGAVEAIALSYRLTSASESIAKRDNLRLLREYLIKQGGFKHITQEQINKLRDWVYAQWKLYLARATNF